MTKDNFHRLLKRQIKEHFGNLDNIPPNIGNFLEAINLAYKDYDKDMAQLEHILKQSSQELFKANKELNLLNSQNEKVIEEKTKHLKKTTYNLQNAEKIAGLGNFSWNISAKSLELSEQMMSMCELTQNCQSLDELIEVFDNSDAIAEAIYQATESNKKFTLNNVRIKNDSRYFMMEGEVLNTPSEQNDKLLLGILQDITISKNKETELNELLQTLENYKKAVDYAGIVSKSDKFGIITYVNHKFTEISGYEEQELLGKQHNIVNSKHHDKAFFNDMWKTINAGEIWKGVIKNKKKDGTYYWVESTIVPFFKNGHVYEFISIRFDITEKTEQSIERQKSLEEKEALLGEIHHRVKNNLALVLGLIEMQITKIGNESMKHEFHDVQHRISAMALIHEKLYKSNNFAKINLQEYLQDLIRFLNNFYNKGKDIKIQFDMDAILASTKKAIPIALIVNELITNCFKYAFKDAKHGEIRVILKKIDDNILLSIADNGPGIPDNIDLTKTNSLGFKLLNIFTKQLKGFLEFSNNSGLLVTIKFKNEQENFNS